VLALVLRGVPLPERLLAVIDDAPTKLVLAARLVEWLAPLAKQAAKTLWIVVDGGYA